MNRYIIITIASLFFSTISIAQNESSIELYSDIGFFNTGIDARTLLNSFSYIEKLIGLGIVIFIFGSRQTILVSKNTIRNNDFIVLLLNRIFILTTIISLFN